MLVKSEYSPSGFVELSGSPVYVEQTSEQRAEAQRADRVGFGEMIRTTFNGDESKWEAAQAFNFPKALGRRVQVGGLGESIYSLKAIAAWIAAVKTLAASLPRV